MIPQAMGNDINCGMRLYTTDLKEEELESCLLSLLPQIRRIFFEGGRSIPMNGIQREAMLRHGLTGLLETSGEAKGRGIWSLYDRDEQEKALEYTAFKGSLYTTGTEGLGDFIGAAHTLSYDDQIGSIGGGNHFVEIAARGGDLRRPDSQCMGNQEGKYTGHDSYRISDHRPPERQN